MSVLDLFPEAQGETLFQHLAVQAAHAPEAIALIAPEDLPFTYGHLMTQVGEIGQGLRALGLGRHDRVGLVMPSGLALATAFLAVATHATCAPLNTALRPHEYEAYLTDLQPAAMLLQAGADTPVRTVAQALGITCLDLSSQRDATGRYRLTGASHTPPVPVDQARPDDVALMLPTSGTTARPKLVPLTHRNLCTSARQIAASLALQARDRCLNVMPLFHIHGLVGAMLASLTAGASVVCSPGFVASKFFDWLEAFRPTWYTAVPTMHQAVLARAASHRDSIARYPLRFIRSCSASLPPSVLEALEAAFRAPVIEAYGMTEAAHQIASNPLPPRTRKIGSVGVPTGVEMAVIDETGQPLAPGQTGELVIRGANVTPGYANNPEANAEAFINGWLRTGDQGYLDADGCVFLTGRLKELINRGGEKLAPREVEAVLLAHPAVAQAVVFALPETRLGEEVAAAVVQRPHTSVTDRSLQAFVADRLAAFKVPRRILFVEDIPKGPTGKLQRLGLAERLGLTGPEVSEPPPAPFSAPQTALDVQVAALWTAVLEIEGIGLHDDFFQLGGDSILVTQLLARLRETLHVEIPFTVFFETPTVAGMLRQIITAGQMPTTPCLPRSLTHSRGGTWPLSFTQQSLWLLEQLEPDNPTYNRPTALRLTGDLEVSALEQSLHGIIARHEILRTRFPAIDGLPTQVIEPVMAVPLHRVDLREWSEPDREVEARRRAVHETRNPFDLARGPLLRATLLRLADQEHILLLVLHHIVCDAWSANVLVQELTALYDASVAGQDVLLPALPVQYADVAVWQRQWLQGEVLETQLAYWQEQLKGAPAVLALPTDRPRPAVRTFRGARHTLTLPISLTKALKALSRQAGVTLFMTLLAGFKALLARYTGQHDIVVGSPIAGRTHVETEPLIGCLVNMLVLRTDVQGNPTFRELLRRVREVTLGAYAHQALPFENLVEALMSSRDLSYTPLFQVLFNLENLPRIPSSTQRLGLKHFEFDPGVAAFDLSLELIEADDGLCCVAEYNTDLFNPDTMVRLLGYFQTLLAGIAANPDQRLADLPLLPEAERRRVVSTWNATETPCAQAQYLHHLVEAQVERTPEAVAVRFEDEQLSYRDLNQRANQLAHWLQAHGVGPETLVGICVERSLEMVVGLLGILKAGGAYVPLDPTYPEERLAFMLDDARVPVLLTQRRLVDRLPKSPVTVVFLDEAPETLGSAPDANLGVPVSADQLAYVMYTSGSTGEPKGVSITQRGVVRLVKETTYARFGADEVFVQLAPLAFDASTFEIWGALLNGAKLVVLPAQTPTLEEVGRALRRHGVTTLWLTAGLFHQMVEAQLEALMGVGQLLSGGDVLSVSHVRRVLSRLGGGVLINAYGPTENTTFTCCHAMGVSSQVEASVPIGRPIAKTQVYVLDERLEPVPMGVQGELYVGGAGLARGYWRRPDLTADRFVPHPFSDEPGARLYRTGDLVRYLPDGSLAFMGRLDHQVKLRGFRIELGEIEAVLGQHAAVSQVVVLAREDRPGDKRLVAYIVLAWPDRPATDTELRGFLHQKLPGYMVPSAFVYVDALPLTPNGKVDRRALPAPAPVQHEPAGAVEAPRGAVEATLAEIWAEVLGLEWVGIHDNFFDLGGHSLLATQIISRVRELFQVNLPMRRLFEAPTIAGFAALIRQVETSPGAVNPMAITPLSRGPHHRSRSATSEPIAPEVFTKDTEG